MQMKRKLGAMIGSLALIAVACGGSSSPEPRAAVKSVTDGSTTTTVATADPPASTTTTAVEAPEDTSTSVADTSTSRLDCAPGTGASFANQILVAQNFGDENLRCADFTGAELAQANFGSADASGALFVGSSLAQPNFGGTELVEADFTGAQLAQPNFSEADLTGADLRSATMTQPNFEDTTCPDGSNSDDNGDTCLGSLDIAAAGTTATTVVESANPGRTDLTVADCAGSYVGAYDGSSVGVAAATVAPDGSISLTFTSADSGGVGVFVGAGSIGPSGSTTIITATGATATGGFDFSNCTMSGDWTFAATGGTWRLGMDSVAVDLSEECDGSGSITIGGGSTGGITIGGDGSISIGGDGGGDIVIDVDGACLGAAVSDAEIVEIEGVDSDEIEVRQGDGFTSYGVTADLLFDFDSAEVKPLAQAALDQIVASIAERSAGQPIQVLGHTDALGGDSYNQELSQRRADAVASTLRSELAGADITATGLGETQPVAPNANPDGTDNPTGRAQNRRVEIIVAS